jgi:fatty acid desaturase
MATMNTDATAPVTGEEFRQDLRGTAHAGRRSAAQVRGGLPAEVLARLTRLSPWRSTFALATTLGALALLLALGWVFFTPWVVVPAVLAIGVQQHALFVLAHDAAHYRLFETRWLNDTIGRLVGSIGGVSMMSYRVIHRLHHNNLYGETDPDIALHGGYPRGKTYLLKKLAKDAAGLTAWKTYAYFFGNPAINAQTKATQRPLDDTSAALRQAARRDRWGVVAFHIAAPAVAFIAGGAPALAKYLVLWALPLVLVVPPILRLRAICEHGAVTDLSTPLTAARTNRVGWLGRATLFPHHVNYHVEHHLFPAVPHYRLPELHAELKQRGMLEGAEVRPLADTLRRVFSERGSLPVAAS